MTTEAGPPPGWYPDPQMPATQRYWSGTGWSEHVAPMPPQQPVSRHVEDRDRTGLVGAGYVTAAGVPPIGVIFGIVLLCTSRVRTGIGVLVVSLIATVTYAILLGALANS